MTVKYKTDAETACQQSDYREPGRYDTLAAYNSLSKCDFPNPERVTTGTYIGLSTYCFQNAAFTFRLAGNDERCDNRVEQAYLVIKDFDEYTFQYDALRGLARESIGDLHVIQGDNQAAVEQYNAARERYTTVSETDWLAETIFEWSFEFFREIMESAGRPVSVEDQILMLNSFEERITIKREMFPDGIETVLRTGEYTPGS